MQVVKAVHVGYMVGPFDDQQLLKKLHHVGYLIYNGSHNVTSRLRVVHIVEPKMYWSHMHAA